MAKKRSTSKGKKKAEQTADVDARRSASRSGSAAAQQSGWCCSALLPPPLELCDRESSRCPDYSQADYPFISQGFIVPGFPLLRGLYSHYLFPNNETMNCITQLAGLLVFLWMVLTVRGIPQQQLIDRSEYHNVTAAQAEARRFYYEMALGSCLLCCCSSLLCHQFQAWSLLFHNVLSVCDWSGTLLIALSTCVAMDSIDLSELILHHVKTEWLAQALVWSTGPDHLKAVVLVLAVVLAILAFADTSHAFRFGIIFVVMIAVAVPGICLCFILRPVRSCIALVSIIIGGTAFGTHLPEKLYPRSYICDIVCPSHSIWHVGYLVCLATTFDTFSVIFFGKSAFF